jgi:hypothetical protein
VDLAGADSDAAALDAASAVTDSSSGSVSAIHPGIGPDIITILMRMATAIHTMRLRMATNMIRTRTTTRRTRMLTTILHSTNPVRIRVPGGLIHRRQPRMLIPEMEGGITSASGLGREVNPDRDGVNQFRPGRR